MKYLYFIMNAGVKVGEEITHAILEGKIDSCMAAIYDIIAVRSEGAFSRSVKGIYRYL